jgi:hypothetical protein
MAAMHEPAASAAWFSRVGAPLSPAEAAALDALRRAAALPGASAAGSVGHWYEAGAIARAADRDGAWWDREEEERERLWECAAERHGEDGLAAELAGVHDRLRDAVHAAAMAAMASHGVADPALAREAAAAALLAAHQWALARLAGAGGDHYFTVKFELFAGGRWPLGVQDGRYWVF